MGYYTHSRALVDAGQAHFGTKLRDAPSDDGNFFAKDQKGQDIIIPSPEHIIVLEEWSTESFLCIKWEVESDNAFYQ